MKFKVSIGMWETPYLKWRNVTIIKILPGIKMLRLSIELIIAISKEFPDRTFICSSTLLPFFTLLVQNPEGTAFRTGLDSDSWGGPANSSAIARRNEPPVHWTPVQAHDPTTDNSTVSNGVSMTHLPAQKVFNQDHPLLAHKPPGQSSRWNALGIDKSGMKSPARLPRLPTGSASSLLFSLAGCFLTCSFQPN